MNIGFWCGNVGVRNRLEDMCKWKDNSKMNLQRIHLELDSIHLAEDRGK